MASFKFKSKSLGGNFNMDVVWWFLIRLILNFVLKLSLKERESVRESLFTSFTKYRYLSCHTFDYLFAMLYSGLLHHCPCEKSIAGLLLMCVRTDFKVSFLE